MPELPVPTCSFWPFINERHNVCSSAILEWQLRLLSLGVCLPAPKYFFLGTELYIGYHKTPLVLSQREAWLLKLGTYSALSYNENDQVCTNSPGKKLCHQVPFWTTPFLAHGEHSCAVTRRSQHSSRLGCTLEPLTSGTQYEPGHFRSFTLTENLLQTLRSTVQSTSAILTSVKPGNCSLARFSQVGAKFLQWPHLETKERDLFRRYTFQFISTVLLQ